MYRLCPEHPEIAHALQTGAPSKPTVEEDEEDDHG